MSKRVMPENPEQGDSQGVVIYLCCTALMLLKEPRDRADVVKYLQSRYGPAGTDTLGQLTQAIKEEMEFVNNALLKTQGLPTDVAMDMARVTAPLDRMGILTRWAKKAHVEKAAEN